MPPVPKGQCAHTSGVDCPGEDVMKVNNVSGWQECCTLCLNHKECIAAVLAVGSFGVAPGGQCMMKSSCDAPTTMPDRELVRTGRTPNGPPESSQSKKPWQCLAARSMIGGYSNLERLTDAYLDNSAHIVTLLEAAQAAATASKGQLEITFEEGVAVQSTDTSHISAAAAAASAADVAIVVVGDTAEGVGYDGSASCGEGADRPSLDLPGVQLDLLDAVLKTGTPTIVILVHGRPATFATDYGGAVTSKFGPTPLTSRMGALIAAWRPGVEGGNALWSLITGAAPFSGRLAQSWPISVGAIRYGGISPWYAHPNGTDTNGPYAHPYAHTYAHTYAHRLFVFCFSRTTHAPVPMSEVSG